MPKTLDNHLVGVTADRPHPESYGADVPLRSEIADRDERYDAGYDAGYTAAESRWSSRAETRADEHSAEIGALQGRLDAAARELADARQQLEAKKSA